MKVLYTLSEDTREAERLYTVTVKLTPDKENLNTVRLSGAKGANQLKKIKQILKKLKSSNERSNLYSTSCAYVSYKLSNWLANFHGVATKYLNNYLAWYSFLFKVQKLTKIQ